MQIQIKNTATNREENNETVPEIIHSETKPALGCTGSNLTENILDKSNNS